MTRYLTLTLCLLALPATARDVQMDRRKRQGPLFRPAAALEREEGRNHQNAKASGRCAAACSRARRETGHRRSQNPAEQEMEFRKRRLETAEAEAKAQKDAQAAADKKRTCDQATAQVTALERGGRVTKAGPNGEQNYLSDQEIAGELAEARKAQAAWCK